MTGPGRVAPLGLGAFGFFAVLAGLVLLAGANHAAPGCTGPAVQRCDYVTTATAAVAQTRHHSFQSDLGFEVFDQGSSVVVQQFTPPGEPELNHAPSVLIDKRSCRACQVDWHQPTPRVDPESTLGAVIERIPAEDAAGAAKRAERWRDGPGGISLL